MPAQDEEIILRADPLHAQHVGEDPAQDLLGAPSPAPGPAPAPLAWSGAGSAARSSFPLGVSGSASSTTNADGTR